MAQSNKGSSPKGSSHMQSDACSQAIPNPAYAVTSATEGEDHATTTPTKIDPTFIQNQISIQRSPSTAHSQVTALSRKLSVKSSGSFDPSLQSAIASVLAVSAELDRGRVRGDSDSSVTEAVKKCTLQRSDSNATDKSAKSTKSVQSTKSVRSVHAVGGYSYGTLRVHSPSPTRKNVDTYEGLKSGDVVIVRDMTPGSIFGCDSMSFAIKTSGEFDGIRDIPYGAHFVWGGTNAVSSRNGFWIMSSKRSSNEFGEIHVKHWNTFEETLEEEHSAAEVRIQKDDLPGFFAKMKSYSLIDGVKALAKVPGDPSASRLYAKDANLWHHLTSCMKGALLTKITGKPWNKWQVSSGYDRKRPLEEMQRSKEGIEFQPEEVLDFIFPKARRTFSENSFGRERTEQAMDTSAHIMAIITGNCTYEDSDEIIGEMQFCYITGMTLGNAACMEQWAHIVKVLFRAYRLALDYPVFFRKAIEAIHAQFMYDDLGFEGSILDLEEGLEEELKIVFTTFKSRLCELLLSQGNNLRDDQKEVGNAFEALEAWLWKWNWDLRGNYVRSGKYQLEDGEFVDAEMKDFEAEDERGEFAPVVVMLDDEGREEGMVRFDT